MSEMKDGFVDGLSMNWCWPFEKLTIAERFGFGFGEYQKLEVAIDRKQSIYNSKW